MLNALCLFRSNKLYKSNCHHPRLPYQIVMLYYTSYDIKRGSCNDRGEEATRIVWYSPIRPFIIM